MNPDDWQARLTAMEGQRWPVRSGMRLGADEVAVLRDGCWPQDTQDRWAVWLDGEDLRCWQAWTGTCVYEAQVLIADDGSGKVGVLDILDEPQLYARARTEIGELERFEGTLRQALSAREAL